MSSVRRFRGLLCVAASVLAPLAVPTDCAAAQGTGAAAVRGSSSGNLPGIPARVPRTPGDGGRHVVISLDENRLYLMEGDRVVWWATVGTGKGHRLEAEDRAWDFSTPAGRFEVQRKERDPVWILPEWVFVQRGEPIPALESPLRREEGRLGAAALYLSNEIAIHGTDQPELLGEPVSHGCVRMTNDDVLRLYRELEVGTPVLIH
jgi:hypothetical protein